MIGLDALKKDPGETLTYCVSQRLNKFPCWSRLKLKSHQERSLKPA